MEQENPQGAGQLVELEPTWTFCLKIWWSLFWRGTLLGILIGFLLGFLLSVGLKFTGSESRVVGGTALVITCIVWLLMTVVAVKKIFTVKFHEFRIALVARR